MDQYIVNTDINSFNTSMSVNTIIEQITNIDNNIDNNNGYVEVESATDEEN
jgi:hypothetical protein